jgi:hypothetical protein
MVAAIKKYVSLISVVQYDSHQPHVGIGPKFVAIFNFIKLKFFFLIELCIKLVERRSSFLPNISIHT